MKEDLGALIEKIMGLSPRLLILSILPIPYKGKLHHYSAIAMVGSKQFECQAPSIYEALLALFYSVESEFGS